MSVFRGGCVLGFGELCVFFCVLESAVFVLGFGEPCGVCILVIGGLVGGQMSGFCSSK